MTIQIGRPQMGYNQTGQTPLGKTRNCFIALAMMAVLPTGVWAGGLEGDNASASGSAIDATAVNGTAVNATTDNGNANSGTASATAVNGSGTATNGDASASTSATTTDPTPSQGTVAQGQAETTGFVAIEDDPLIVDTNSISDDDGLGEVIVQWQISDDNIQWTNISGAIRQSFTPREIHVGRRLRVMITYVDGQGNRETLTSPPSNPVQNVNDKPTGSPILTGYAREEDALVVDTSSIADEDGVGAYDILWQRSSTKSDWQPFPEGTGEVLRLGQNHVGYAYRAVVSYIDNNDSREVLVSSPSETVINVDDPVEGEVTISGTPTEGNTMVVGTSTVSDEDGIASLSISWEESTDGRNWRAIETSSGSALYLGQSLVGRQVRAKASVVDIFGIETLIYSRPSNTVKNINNAPQGTISVRRVGS